MSENQLTLILPDEFKGKRLDHTLAKLLPEYSRTQLKSCLDAGSVKINERLAEGKQKVKGGESVTLTIQAREYTQWEALPITIPILHEDEHIIIVNKPVGMVVHPGAGNPSHTLLNALLHHEPALYALPRAGILHRIDKGTSGLLVVAKTQMALHNLSKQLKEKTLLRHYQAIVFGELISGGCVDAPIGRHAIQRKRMAVTETGKPAVTHYRILEKYRGFTRLSLQLETGRTHQIRVHMAYIKHPIVGDPTYSGRLQLIKNMSPQLIECLRNYKHQALHACSLGLVHPASNETIRFEAPLPKDMLDLIALLKDEKK